MYSWDIPTTIIRLSISLLGIFLVKVLNNLLLNLLLDASCVYT
jgi:hypothetical protein